MNQIPYFGLNGYVTPTLPIRSNRTIFYFLIIATIIILLIFAIWSHQKGAQDHQSKTYIDP